MNKPCPHLMAKSPENGNVTLVEHTEQVLAAAQKLADYLQLNAQQRSIVRWGAILHDMGKASPIFQRRLKPDFRWDTMTTPYRHELGALFFMPLVPLELRDAVVDMIVAHHRSIESDGREQGILDLEERYECKPRGGNVFQMHAEGWEEWSEDVYLILKYFGVETQPISRQQACNDFYDVVEYCESKPNNYSFWKGLLVAADHLASSVNEKVYDVLERSFSAPDLSWYHDEERRSELYPLSQMKVCNSKPHTLVTAPTGAGKTDFLLRRCQGRVFYLLPFQASINAMFETAQEKRAGRKNRCACLHAASRLMLEKKRLD